MKTVIKKRLEAIKRGETPEGYKKTKIGVIPEEWEEKKASDIFINHSNKKHGGIHPVLSSTQNLGIIPRDFLNIDIKYDKNNISNYKKVDIGDYVISLRSFQGGIEYSEYEGLVSPAYTVLKSIVPISNNFYKEYLKTSEFISRLNSSIYGIRDGKQIGYDDFSNLLLHNPPLSEQCKIAEILENCERVIKLKQNLLTEKRKLKKWLLENLLNPNSGVRLPGFKGEWEDKRLGDICCINSSNLTEKTDRCYEFYYLDLSSIDEGKIVYPKEKISFGNAPVRARKLFNKNDILLSTVRPYLHGFAIADFNCKEFVASTGFCILSTKKGISPYFIYYQLFSNKLDMQYNNCLVGTNYPALNSSDIEQLKFIIPSEQKEQEAIVDILFKADNEINLLDKSLAEWYTMKKALMQVLLTGIVRGG